LTSRCFQQCRGCDSWRDDKSGRIVGCLDYSRLLDLLQELYYLKVEHITLTGGDPQAYPDFDRLLRWWGHQKSKHEGWPDLQINTALTRPVSQPPVDWHDAIDEVRVSFDAVDEKLYGRIRGDKFVVPADILQQLVVLNHPNMTTMTVLYQENITEVIPILKALVRSRVRLRKAIFLAGIGDRSPKEDRYWVEYENLDTRLGKAFPNGLPFETSLDESVSWVRGYLSTGGGEGIRCWSGAMAPHIKANGDVYPCCLVGGEALQTYTDMVIGNINDESAEIIMRRYEPPHDYADPDKPCKAICQYKQLQLNIAGEMAARTKLSMP